MKILFYTILAFALVTNCKETQKSPVSSNTQPELSIAQKIANAHGFKNWKHVSEIQFTFNNNRHWSWSPKSDTVTLHTEKDSLSYNRKTIDSISLKADRAFINDKFWLLIPFQLVWDKSATITQPEKEQAPISKLTLNKITLTYPTEGGYTPGDAYDIYYGDDFIITEWVFRKGNKDKASLMNTFENYKNYNGLMLASDHKKEGSDWNLTLTNIAVSLE